VEWYRLVDARTKVCARFCGRATKIIVAALVPSAVVKRSAADTIAATKVYENIGRIHIRRPFFLRRSARRRRARTGKTVLARDSTHRRAIAVREFTDRPSRCSLETNRRRVELCRSHRGDEAHPARHTAGLV